MSKKEEAACTSKGRVVHKSAAIPEKVYVLKKEIENDLGRILFIVIGIRLVSESPRNIYSVSISRIQN